MTGPKAGVEEVCTGCGTVGPVKAYSCSGVSMRLCAKCDPAKPVVEKLTNFMVTVDGVPYVPLRMGEALARILRDTWDSYEACDIVDDEEVFEEERTRVRNALNLWLGEGAWQS